MVILGIRFHVISPTTAREGLGQAARSLILFFGEFGEHDDDAVLYGFV